MTKAQLLIALAMLASACQKDDKTDGTASAAANKARTADETSGLGAARRGDAATLTRYFPPAGTDGAEQSVTAERDGYAEARLRREGKELATLTIEDLGGNGNARAKFQGASERVNGFPVTSVGDETTLLVKDRYQVRVTSSALRHDDRKVWLGKFDLYGLSTQ